MAHDLKDCLGYRMRRLTRVIDSYLKEMLNGFEITEKQMTILFALYEMGETEQGKIAKVLLLENSTISRNIKLLEKLDIIEKSNDYRPKISLSEKGINLANELFPLWNNTMNTLFEKVGQEGLQTIKKMEKKLL